MRSNESLCRRKEKRFKTTDDQSLQCQTAISEDEPIPGAVFDISPSGLRFLCEGNFTVGQTFSTELTADRSYGEFRGVIRRVEPWTGGKSILGCQLIDKIPVDVLEKLAHQEMINRRQDDRVDWNQSAKISWELQQGEFDIQIQDCSPGGLKLLAQQPLPEDLSMRIRVNVGEDEPLVVSAKPIWQQQQEDGILAGLAFTKREVPEAVTRILDRERDQNADRGEEVSIRRSILVAAVVVILGAALVQTGVLG